MPAPSGRCRRPRLAALLVAALAASLLSVTASSSALPGDAAAADEIVPQRACDTQPAGRAACLAIVDADRSGRPLTRAAAATASLHPFTAAELQGAYDLPTERGDGQTIAIVDAFDAPNAEADLAAYRAASGLPPCNQANRCLRKVDQRGGTDYPRPNVGWALEVSLDLDMASTACPKCRLLLVEADDNSFESLGAAVDLAVELGADAVSNSYGGFEFPGELDFAHHYDHPGTAITASSGDSGFGVSAPAAFSSVVGVGGTSLFPEDNARGWDETAWAGAGSGCSAYVAKPSWQHDRLCDKRTVADVAAVADPATPVGVYDSFGFSGWVAVGGTSASAPLLAGLYAMTGTTDPVPGSPQERGDLFDVTSGSNGSCGDSYLCTGMNGYDGPTGWGTPDGAGQRSGPTPPDQPAPCTWQLVPTPQLPGSSIRPTSIDVLSQRDAWLTGMANQAHWVLHWDGHALQPATGVSKIPLVTSDMGAGSFDSDTDGWVIGLPNGTFDVAERWHGGRWTTVPLPVPADPEKTGIAMVKVESLSPTNAWAVGFLFKAGKGIIRGLWPIGAVIEHWDGRRWAIVPNPVSERASTNLTALTAISADDIWAVGRQDDGSGHVVPLAEHWDGAAWSVVPTPAANAPASFRAVRATGSDDVWAVGAQTQPGANLAIPLLEHWDGTRWNVVQNLPDLGNSRINDVYAAGPTDVWAVAERPEGANTFLHWDGAAWTAMAVPGPKELGLRYLYVGLAGTGPGDVWALGIVTNLTTAVSQLQVAHLSCA